MEMQPIGFPPSIAPLVQMPAVARILSRFDRTQLEAFVSVAIDLMDVVDGDPDREVEDPAGETVPVIDDPEVEPDEDDGDPDLEANGDELDGSGAEDDFGPHSAGAFPGPGCPIADPDFGVEDEQGYGVGDRSYAEWHTLSAKTQRAGRIDGKPKDSWLQSLHEDAEDDDPAEDNGDREPDGDEQDGTNAEDEALCASFMHGLPAGPGCDLSDPGGTGDEG